MNKQDFITAVAGTTGETKKATEATINAALQTITDTLAKGDTVSFIGFGTFSTSARAARDGHNPSTGEKIKIAATTTPKFKAGAHLKAAVK